MRIVTTFHQPSSVLASVRCRLSARDADHLVVAKLNRVEVYSLRSAGTSLECSLEVYGKVAAVKAIPISVKIHLVHTGAPRYSRSPLQESTRSNLVVLLAHPDPELIFLSYTESESGPAELQLTKQLSLYERTPRPAEFFNDVLVHPSGKLAVVSCYLGKLKIINLKAGRYQNDFDAMLIFQSAFLLSVVTECCLFQIA
jgi:DNA damage-binding protein 1